MQTRGRAHCAGEVLVFDRLNLELAIESALSSLIDPFAGEENKS